MHKHHLVFLEGVQVALGENGKSCALLVPQGKAVEDAALEVAELLYVLAEL